MIETNTSNPYVGPRTFTTEEREFFFGREREARDLLSVVITERLVLFYAQSGAGKSSLINTRLIPGLIEEGEYRILPVGRLLGEAIKREDVENIYIYNLITSLIKRRIDGLRLAKLTLPAFLAGLDYDEQEGYFYNEYPISAPVEEDVPWKYVLIIDQFEELFTAYPEEWKKREDFFLQLAQAMQDFPNLGFVLTMREDFVALLEPYAHLVPGRLRSRYYMQRLGQRGALEAIQGPARRLGRPFVPEVAQKLVNDLSMVQIRQPDDSLKPQPGQYVEPVQLQVVCYSLWDQLPEDCEQITQEHLDQFVGDVDRALGNYFAARVDSVVAEMKQQDIAVSEHDIREWFGKKLITSDGIRNMVAQERGGNSGEVDDRVVQEFVRKGDLVRAEKRGGATFYELTHDRLVEPILQNNKEWFDTKADLLQQRARVWLGQGRSASFLLRGKDLRDARNLALTRPLTGDEKFFLDISIRTQWTRSLIILVAGTALIVMVILTTFAIAQSQNAEAARSEAENQRSIAQIAVTQAIQQKLIADKSAADAKANEAVAVQLRNLAETNETQAEVQGSIAKAQIYQNVPGGLFKSTLLAMDAILRSQSPSPDAEEILRENLTFLPRRVDNDEIQQSGAIDHMEFNSDGTALYTSSWTGQKGEICGWRLPSREEIFCREISSQTFDLYYNREGQLMAGDSSGNIRTLDAKNGGEEQVVNLSGIYRLPIRSLVIGPDGRKILIIKGNGSITVKDLRRPKIEDYYIETSMIPNSTVLSPNGLWLAAGGVAGTVAHWGLTDGSYDSRTDHHGLVNVLRFTPNEALIVSGGDDHYAYVTDRLTNELRYRLPHSGRVQHLEVSPDGTWIATSTDDRQIRVWNLLNGKEKVRFLQDSPITKLMISPKGQLIITVGEDKNLRAWNAETGKEIIQIPLDTNDPILAFNPTDHYLYYGDKQGQISIWDIFTLATPARSLELSSMAENIQYAPSDTFAFTDGGDVWMLPTNEFQELTTFPKTPPVFKAGVAISHMALSPSLRYLGVSTDNNDVVVINQLNGRHFNFKPQGTIKDLSFTSDRERLITLDTDGRVLEWELSADAVPSDLVPENLAGSAISVGPGFLALGMRGRIWFMDLNTHRVTTDLQSDGDHMLMKFSQDGSLLADANSDGQINLWEQKNGVLTLLYPLSVGDTTPKPQALALAFSPDGKRLAIGTAKNVFLIATTSGQEIARIPIADLVNDISFSKNGQLLTIATSNLIQTWELGSMQPIDDLVQAACVRVGKNLDESQWKDVLTRDEYNFIMAACGR